MPEQPRPIQRAPDAVLAVPENWRRLTPQQRSKWARKMARVVLPKLRRRADEQH